LGKREIFISLFATYLVYSIVVYTTGTDKPVSYAPTQEESIIRGKEMFQQHNCISCHQLYGLGGYLGPELTTVWSDKHRGEAYMKSFLKNGGLRMPQFNFTNDEIDCLVSYLEYVDSTATTYKKLNP